MDDNIFRLNNGSNSATSRSLATRHRIPMNGACAVVARSNAWTKNPHDLQVNLETGEREEIGGDLQPMWDYRIKVEPWQVFGTVEFDIMGDDIVVEHVRGSERQQHRPTASQRARTDAHAEHAPAFSRADAFVQRAHVHKQRLSPKSLTKGPPLTFAYSSLCRCGRRMSWR